MASTLSVLNAARLAFYDNRPTALMIMTSSWSTPNNVSSPLTPAPWNGTQIDNWGGHSNTTNNTRYTVQVAGTYQVSALMTWTTNGTGVREADLMKNGSAFAGCVATSQVSAAQFCSVQLPAYNIACNVGDYIEVGGYQNSGAALNTVVGGCYFAVTYLHP